MHHRHVEAGKQVVDLALAALIGVDPKDVPPYVAARLLAIGASLERDTLVVSVEELQGVDPELDDDPWERVGGELEATTTPGRELSTISAVDRVRGRVEHVVVTHGTETGWRHHRCRCDACHRRCSTRPSFAWVCGSSAGVRRPVTRCSSVSGLSVPWSWPATFVLCRNVRRVSDRLVAWRCLSWHDPRSVTREPIGMYGAASSPGHSS